MNLANLTAQAPKWTAPAYRNPSTGEVLSALVALELATQDGSFSARALLAEITG